MGELEEGIDRIKIEKTSISDNIAPEMIKYVGMEGKIWVIEVFETAWQTNKTSKDWEENLLIIARTQTGR